MSAPISPYKHVGCIDGSLIHLEILILSIEQFRLQLQLTHAQVRDNGLCVSRNTYNQYRKTEFRTLSLNQLKQLYIYFKNVEMARNIRVVSHAKNFLIHDTII